MEQNFQTSFIPKKPIIEERSTPARGSSFLLIISIFVFFTIVLTAGGLYFYKGILEKNITTLSESLAKSKERFDPEKIVILQNLDKRLIASNEILVNHAVVSPIFKVLQEITKKSIQYTKFSYSTENGKGSRFLIKMSGQASSYKDIAMQADLFAKNKNLVDAVFSNLALDVKGKVSFDLDFSVDPKFVDYKQVLKTESNNSSVVGDTNAGILN